MLSLTTLVPGSPLGSAEHRDAFEVYWFVAAARPTFPTPISWLRLVAPDRLPLVPPTEQPGQVLRFSRDYLEEDDKEYAVDVFKLFNQAGEPPHLPLTAVQEDCLRAIVALLAGELQEQTPSRLILKALLKVVLLHLIRWQQQHFTPQDLQEKRVYQFLQLLDAHYTSQTQVAFYAGRLGVSGKRLNQILLAKLHKSATQLLHERLVLEAKRELTLQERTIREIAFRLGFEEPSYFARFFKKHTGITPSVYQQQVST